MINFQKIKEFTSKIEHWFESLNLKYELKENYYIVSHMGRDYAIIPILDDIELESLESLHKDLVYISLKENFIPNQVVLTVSQLYQAKDIIQQNNGMRDILLDIILSCKRTESLFEIIQKVEQKKTQGEVLSEEGFEEEQQKSNQINQDEILIKNNLSRAMNSNVLHQNKKYFASEDGTQTVLYLISKRIEKRSEIYWYTIQPKQKDKLEKGKNSYIALACRENYNFFLLSIDFIKPYFNDMLTSTKDNEQHYHIKIGGNGDKFWLKLRGKKKIDITQFYFINDDRDIKSLETTPIGDGSPIIVIHSNKSKEIKRK